MMTDREAAVVAQQYRGCTYDSRLPDGGILLKNAGGGYQKVSKKQMAGLMQRNDHVAQDNAESNSAKARAIISDSEITQEAYDASIRNGKRNDGMDSNPFHKKANGRNTFGNPDVGRPATGLPSDSDTSHHGLPSNRNDRHYRPNGAPISNLPSERK